MEAILKPLRIDLENLFNRNEIEAAKSLNDKFDESFKISQTQLPMYFTGKFDAKTVFVMLNPGAATNKNYSIESNKEYKDIVDFDEFFKKYLINHHNYGEKNNQKIDNFDLKQAAFLCDFENSGLNISKSFNENNLSKLEAQKEVLMNKLQLELIPYCSVSFKGVLDTKKQANNNVEKFSKHIERLFDAIISYNREYVIFGSRQFHNLFKALQSDKNKVGNLKNIEFLSSKSDKVTDLKRKVTWSIVLIKYKEKEIKAIIANSFPRRDLPNAYTKMREYGRKCFEDFKSTFNK